MAEATPVPSVQYFEEFAREKNELLDRIQMLENRIKGLEEEVRVRDRKLEERHDLQEYRDLQEKARSKDVTIKDLKEANRLMERDLNSAEKRAKKASDEAKELRKESPSEVEYLRSALTMAIERMGSTQR